MIKKRGYRIGVRLIEEFLAKTGLGKCADFRETADVIAKVRFMKQQQGFLKKLICDEKRSILTHQFIILQGWFQTISWNFTHSSKRIK